MSKIALLSQETIDKIAAGEVVECPSFLASLWKTPLMQGHPPLPWRSRKGHFPDPHHGQWMRDSQKKKFHWPFCGILLLFALL